MSNLAEAAREACVLIKIATSALGLSRTDKAASAATTSMHGAAEGSARVLVSRLPGADELHRKIIALQNETRQTIFDRSMPWDNNGWRLLPNTQLQWAMAYVTGQQQEFDHLLSELRHQASQIIATAEANRGSFSVEVPTEDELIEAYSLEHNIQPLPEGSQFRGLPQEVADKLQHALDQRVATAVEAAQTDVMRRLSAPLENFVERMRLYDEREEALERGEEVGRAGVFRDSVLHNIQSIVGMLDEFNVGDDERMATLKQQLEVMGRLTPEALRTRADVRKAAATRAQKVADNLNSWLAPPAQTTPQAAE